MTILLGGPASPIGWSVQYVDAGFDEVLADLLLWRGGFEDEVAVSAPRPFPAVLENLLPFQAPWTRELLLPCGRWTAYLNNGVGGGDPSASAAVIARRLEKRWVHAMHTRPHGSGHQATQLWVCGPNGEPPLMYERALAAVATDGRWDWDESGRPFPFEDLSRYRARRKRDRFDRQLLLSYLEALGIHAADDTSYGPGVIVQKRAEWHLQRPPRVVTLAEARAEIIGSPWDA